MEDAVAGDLEGLDAPAAPGGQPLNVASAVADALAQDAAEDSLDDAGDGDDDASPIETRDLDAIVETFLDL